MVLGPWIVHYISFPQWGQYLAVEFLPSRCWMKPALKMPVGIATIPIPEMAIKAPSIFPITVTG